MKDLFREQSMANISYYKELLAANGIATHIKNEVLPIYRGHTDELPALAVLYDADYDKALEIMKADLEASKNADGKEVRCKKCEETSPQSFAICWNCGADLPEVSKPVP